MPIDNKEFGIGEHRSKVDEEIISFLDKRKEKAFTPQEIMSGIRSRTDFSTEETTKISTFAVASFVSLLHDLLREGKINMKVVKGQTYFTVLHGHVAKCPKCGKKISEPKKTWTMTGRPDKKGKRLQLHIGLFECKRHGFFRTALSKRKI